jgi:hypothetical protein
MNFPEITQWSNNVVSLLQIIGGAITAICVAVIAVIIISSLGNETKVKAARDAAVCLVIGLFILIAASKIADVIKALTNFLGK